MTTQQYDLIPGLDPSGLSAITQAQLLAFGSQAAPFDNVGFIIVGSGASSAHPNITDNPRFIRYIWLDTQTPGTVLIKIYQGDRTVLPDDYASWQTITIADASIVATKIADYAVSILNASNDPKIAYQQSAAADSTKANYILRLDSAGQFVEIAPISGMVSALTLNPAKLDVSAATDGWVLSYDSSLGTAVWKAISISGLITPGTIGYDKLFNATIAAPGYILRSNPTTGVWEAIIPNDLTNTLFPIQSIPLNKLAVTGAVAKDIIRFDGTNWVKSTPYVNTAGPALSVAKTGSVAHGLNAVPTWFTAMIKYTGAGEHGYVNGDVASLSACLSSASNQALCCSADDEYIYLTQAAITGLEIRNKTDGTGDLMTETAWNWVFYASL